MKSAYDGEVSRLPPGGRPPDPDPDPPGGYLAAGTKPET